MHLLNKMQLTYLLAYGTVMHTIRPTPTVGGVLQ